MNINNLNNKKIAILGLGMENQALIKYLLKHKIKCEITICDARNKKELGEKYDELNNVETRHGAFVRRHWQLGKNFNQGLEKLDILFRSPGWPIDCPGIVTAQKKKPPLPPFTRGAKYNPPNPLYQGGVQPDKIVF